MVEDITIARMSRTINPRSLSHGGDDDQEEEEVLKHQDGDDHEDNKAKKTSI